MKYLAIKVDKNLDWKQHISHLQLWTKYISQTLVSCEMTQYGKTLISLFQQFSAGIKKNFSSEGKLGTRL